MHEGDGLADGAALERHEGELALAHFLDDVGEVEDGDAGRDARGARQYLRGTGLDDRGEFEGGQGEVLDGGDKAPVGTMRKARWRASDHDLVEAGLLKASLASGAPE